MELIISILLLLFISALFVIISRKIFVPEVIALMLVGLLVAWMPIRSLLIGDNVRVITYLGDAGLFSLMFLAGLETSWANLYREKKDSFILAIITALVSFSLGFLVLYYFGFSLTVSLMVGVVMSVTAEATRAKVLIDLKALKTRVGAALMGAGIVDDLFGLAIFTSLMFFLNEGNFYNDFLLVGVIISFFLGIIFHKYLGRAHICTKTIEKLMGWLIVPFFFVSIGLSFDFSLLILSPLLVLGIVFLGFSGKFTGSFASKPFVNFSWKQLHLISWAMNSKGAISLVLALIAFKSNLIPAEIYSSLVVMALITTGVFPFVIARMIKKNRKIMD